MNTKDSFRNICDNTLLNLHSEYYDQADCHSRKKLLIYLQQFLLPEEYPDHIDHTLLIKIPTNLAFARYPGFIIASVNSFTITVFHTFCFITGAF